MDLETKRLAQGRQAEQVISEGMAQVKKLDRAVPSATARVRVGVGASGAAQWHESRDWANLIMSGEDGRCTRVHL